MSQGTKYCESLPEELRTLYEPVREQIEQVDQRLWEELHSNNPFVDRLTSHGFRLGGKRLRPALVLLSGLACGPLNAKHVVLAAAMEMIHMASLIHDDVLDEATLRRHLQTVNARWDNETSVLLGDYLLARALCLVAELDSVPACRDIAHTSRTMCEGELRQVAHRGDYAMAEDEYLDLIADKTAALCACCCRLGAFFAGADSDMRQALSRFGSFLGVAFQITDDILDVVGDENTMGKSLGTDLAKHKPTLPCIRLLSQATGQQRAEVLSILMGRDNHRDALRPWLEQSDALAYARQKAEQFISAADAELEKLPPGPAVDALRGLAEFVIQRRQ